MAEANETLKTALSYAARGWSVIPVTWKGDKKAPLIQWAKWNRERADGEQITAWWEMYPEAGIGVVTGKISNLTVIDIDRDALERCGNAFPRTWMMSTTANGGWHLYYEHVEGLDTEAMNGMSVRSDGAYVVAPPTQNDNGDGYSWTCNAKPMDASAEDIKSAIRRVL